ncbi:type IV secretory system conjugative DNA transfer family protein [Pseudarthrobacter phenanthrenivorans]|uniref:FtsK domain-containing protein n=1 Tax=Pseudarthrobacter phenanthrenivorans TaxID=361575 RepID=A0A0B4DWA0_PSEPS|nr:helicase HerA-like domain-containing protein [Pseudarthrobacter phenanthrenivorans]KIC68725.1 hypothetical protein RM50_04525 [Pseudarthrobacter phenanthrenivorans]
MSTTTANRLALGHAEDQSPISLDLAASAHTLVVGGTGSGKTVALRQLATQALDQGFEVVIIDAIRRALGFRAFADRATLAATHDEAIRVLEGLDAGLSRRDEGARPILVIIDEYAPTVIDEPLPRGLNKADPLYIEAQEHNARTERIRHLVEAIIRKGRSAGVHLVISTQRPDCETLPGAVREHLGNAIIAVRPGMRISDLAAMVVHGFATGANEAAVNDALTQAAAQENRGHAVLVSSGTVTPFRVTLPANA